MGRLTFLLIILTMATYTNAQTKTKAKISKSSTVCSDDCQAKNKKGGLTCKLTTPELRERKATVIASLKKQMMEKKELKNGFVFREF